MKIIADTHSHTIASTHAYSTITEMVKAAADKGLYALAITDHSTAMPGSPQYYYFDNLRVIPSSLMGVRVLKGIEANILDFEGRLDMSESILSNLEWVIASIHGSTIREKEFSVEKCTELWLNVAKNPLVTVIGHSGGEKYKYDYETVIKRFAENGKLVEINNSSYVSRPESISNCIEIAKICKKLSVPIVVNSDAHFSVGVGDVSKAMKMLEEIDFPQELIVNADINHFKSYLRERNIPLE